jgi:hypothetical protein
MGYNTVDNGYLSLHTLQSAQRFIIGKVFTVSDVGEF